MIRIVVQSEVADQIRRANGQVELIDDQGNPLGVVRRPPTEAEIEYAKSRIGTKGPKLSIDELLEKVEAL